MRRACFMLAVIGFTGSALAAQHPLFTVNGTGTVSAAPGFGYSVDAAGDVNGDGVADLIGGGPYDVNPGARSGQARVLSGAGGAQLLPTFIDTLGQSWAHFGWSVTGVGDVSGDGVPDLAVGAPQFGGASTGGKGYVSIRSGANGSELFRKIGDAAGDELGYSVAGTGDVDLDGVPDWAAGATDDHELTEGPGYARIFSGATGSVLYTYTTTGFGKRFGASLVNAGDANLDGRPDLLVGVSGALSVRLFSGATGTQLWSRNGPGYYGWDVDRVGDVDGNGVTDLIVGAPTGDKARLLRADTGATLFDVLGPFDRFFGGAVAGLGDVDLDGRDDFAVGAKWGSSPTVGGGATWVYSGMTHLPIRVFYGHESGDLSGFALSRLGDVDGNGLLDFAIGSPQDFGAGFGKIDVFTARPPRRVRER